MVSESSSSSPNTIASISLFIHRYINDFLLQDISSLETSLLGTLILIAVGGHSWIGSAEVWEHATTTLRRKRRGAIVISPALQSFIFSEVIRFVLRNVGEEGGEKKVLLGKGPLSGVFSSTCSEVAAFAFTSLINSLKSASDRLIFEHPAHVLVLKCLDHIFDASSVLTSSLSLLSFSHLVDTTLSVFERLACFSLIRLLLTKATNEAVSSLKKDPSGKGVESQSPFIVATNRVLSTKVEKEDEKMLEALRLFFLKEFYRSEGTQFAQQVFGVQGVVEAFPWLRYPFFFFFFLILFYYFFFQLPPLVLGNNPTPVWTTSSANSTLSPSTPLPVSLQTIRRAGMQFVRLLMVILALFLTILKGITKLFSV